jgi:hypothetical protein
MYLFIWEEGGDFLGFFKFERGISKKKIGQHWYRKIIGCSNGG